MKLRCLLGLCDMKLDPGRAGCKEGEEIFLCQYCGRWERWSEAFIKTDGGKHYPLPELAEAKVLRLVTKKTS